MKNKISFASDNCASVDPRILVSIASVNQGHVSAYGADSYTQRAKAKFKSIFGPDINTYFVYNGTGANVIAMSTVMNSFHSVICPATAHIHRDECGAPEKFMGSKVITLPSINGKITPKQIRSHLIRIGDEHRSQPRVVSITQPTEYGVIFYPEEIRQIADFVHQHNMYLHVDGTRIANAAAALGCSLRAITIDVGVDILSFGGTKNGLMFGEGVLFFHGIDKNFKYYRKQGMQLASKMRYIAAQFECYLEESFYLANAAHANRMAKLLAENISDIPGISITQSVDANMVFARLARDKILALQEHFYFYIWDEFTDEVRWMMAFDTQEQDVLSFIDAIKKCF